MALCPTFVSQSCVPPKNQHFRHEKTLDKQGLNLKLVPQVRIGLTTPSLPRTCATTTLLRLKTRSPIYSIFHHLSRAFYAFAKIPLTNGCDIYHPQSLFALKFLDAKEWLFESHQSQIHPERVLI